MPGKHDITAKLDNADLTREDLELLVENDNPTAWIARRMLNADNRVKLRDGVTNTEKANA